MKREINKLKKNLMDGFMELKGIEKATKRFDELVTQLIRTFLITSGLLTFAFLIVLTSVTPEDVVKNDLLRAKTKTIYGTDCYYSAGAATILTMAEGASVPIWNVLYLTLLHLINGYRAASEIDVFQVYKITFLTFLSLSFGLIIYSIQRLTKLSENLINLKAPFYPEDIVCKGGAHKYELNVQKLLAYHTAASDGSDNDGAMGLMFQGIGASAQTYVNTVACTILALSSLILFGITVGKYKLN